MSNPRPLAGKVAIITGSTRGVGAAIATRLASYGADVVINYHKVDMAATRMAYGINSAEDKGGRAIVVKADVSTVEGGKKLLGECVKQLGPPNIVVLNASFMGHKPLSEIDEEYFDAFFDTNVKGALFLAKAAAEGMTEGDRIIFISTALTRVSTVLPMALLFAATKGAVEQIVRVLAKDLGQRGITVNAVASGPVDTPLFRAGKSAHMIRWIESLHPQQRLPQADEISPAVAFLASKEAGWINGQTLGVNGVSHKIHCQVEENTHLCS
ncbi:NAD-P-binding protein [Cristinia sonorae]|uniref:NAD-P-binding protein n=1 Tax=Cristinia sonorae TaxID=1940300 RepID=A0A8K0XT41_9AGAR|nr:NAD-P-binding protein [Cristinia sonorae]